jgi:hypothetical protein
MGLVITSMSIELHICANKRIITRVKKRISQIVPPSTAFGRLTVRLNIWLVPYLARVYSAAKSELVADTFVLEGLPQGGELGWA